MGRIGSSASPLLRGIGASARAQGKQGTPGPGQGPRGKRALAATAKQLLAREDEDARAPTSARPRRAQALPTAASHPAPAPRSRSRPAPAVPPAKWRRRHEAPPPPGSFCAPPAGDARCGGPAGPRRPRETARQRGPGRRGPGLSGRGPQRRGPSDTAAARRPLPTAARALRTPQPGLQRCARAQQPHTAAPTRGSKMQTAALPPEPGTPGAGPSAGHALGARPPPRGGRPRGGAPNPSARSGGSANARPAPARRAHPLRLRAYEAGSSSSACLPLPPALAARDPVFAASGVTQGRVVPGGAEGWVPAVGARSFRPAGRPLSPEFIHSLCAGRTAGSRRAAAGRRSHALFLCVCLHSHLNNRAACNPGPNRCRRAEAPEEGEVPRPGGLGWLQEGSGT